MPTNYRIDKTLGMIFSSASGVVTDDDLRGHQRAVLADPGFDPRFSQIWDFERVEEVEVSSEALRALAESKSYSRANELSWRRMTSCTAWRACSRCCTKRRPRPFECSGPQPRRVPG